MKSEPVEFVAKEATRKEWDRYHVYRKIRHTDVRPDDPVVPDDLVEKMMKRDDPFNDHKQFVMVEGDTVVGYYYVGKMKPDAPGYDTNKQFIWIWADALTTHRRRGIGTRWARMTLDFMKEWDKTVCSTSAEEEDGHAFLRWIGASEKQKALENRLNFTTIDWPMIEQWIQQGKERSADISLQLYENSLPEEFFPEYAPILSELLMTMPFDDIDHGEIVVTPETLKEQKSRAQELGSDLHTLVARSADGRLAGMTDVSWNPARSAYITQRFTGVHPDFRGRGLGKLLKAYMLDFLRNRYENLHWVVTGNAVSNDPMMKINKALGFREYKAASIYQTGRDELEKFLSSLPAGR